MGVAVKRFVRSRLTTDEVRKLSQVDRIADQLGSYSRERESEIRIAHVHGAQSSAIQAIVAELLTDRLGCGQEVVLTKGDGFVSRTRFDFVYWLDNGRGIIAEVERGGTVNNNHDLKDFWKEHVAPDAQHLLPIVPNSNWSSNGLPREKPFRRVARRLGAFFGDLRKEVDVISLHLFGYGDDLST